MVLEIMLTNTAVLAILISTIIMICAILTLILRINKSNNDKFEKKANITDVNFIKDQLDKKADKDIVSLMIDHMNRLESRHEAANTQIRKEFLDNIKEINVKIEALSNHIFEMSRK